MVRRIAIRENAAKLSKAVQAMLEEEANLVLQEFALLVVKKTQKTIGSNLSTVVLNIEVPDGTEELWEAALKAVFSEGEVKGRVLKTFKPTYDSVLSHVIKKTSVLLAPPVEPKGEIPDDDDDEEDSGPVMDSDLQVGEPVPVAYLSQQEQAKLINANSLKLCSKVTSVSKTTRRRMRLFFEQHIKEGSTMGQIIADMHRRFPRAIAGSRVAMIVRNELSMAANEAQILSFEGTKSLTHCSVIGCQAIEEDSPTYMGFHTCNIRNVPVADLRKVEFHIGHTGSWVPSGFRDANGRKPRLRLGNNPATGTR